MAGTIRSTIGLTHIVTITVGIMVGTTHIIGVGTAVILTIITTIIITITTIITTTIAHIVRRTADLRRMADIHKQDRVVRAIRDITRLTVRVQS
jgi:hypothetical protein